MKHKHPYIRVKTYRLPIGHMAWRPVLVSRKGVELVVHRHGEKDAYHWLLKSQAMAEAKSLASCFYPKLAIVDDNVKGAI